MVQAGLPWPAAEDVAHDTRKLVTAQNVPWLEGEDIHDRYAFDNPLGTGGFAKVFKGTRKEDGRDVAIKHITVVEEGDREVVHKEIKHLTMLRDVKQVVTIFEVYEHNSDFHIVMELCKGGELHASFEDGEAGFTYGDIGRIAVCMLVLADAMHTRGFVHCDLKPENFCLAEPRSGGLPLTESLRLIDFGLSQRVRGGQAIAGLAGSIPYMAPEIRTRMYDHKVDVWSIGVIIYTLLHGRLPFDGRSAEEIMSRAATREPDVSALHPAVADFIKWLLCKDPKKRPEARDALGHPWLKVTSVKIDGGDAVMRSVSNEVLQNLTVFAASNKLQRVFMHLLVGFMSRQEMEKSLKMFNTLNMDRTTPLHAAEIKALLSRGRHAEEAEKIGKTVDLVMGRDGELSIEDFVVAAMNQYRHLSDAVIKTMFTTLDSDNDGWVTAEDAYAALHPLGIHLTVKELEDLFDRYGVKRRLGDSKSSSGLMTYHEFHELMMPSVSQRFHHELDDVVAALQDHHNASPFEKLVRRIVAENAPPTRELARIQRAFRTLDKDGSDTLTREELLRGLRSAGYVVSDADMARVFADLDTDGTGLVRYHEFVAGALDHNILVGDSILRWLFDYLDDDDSNTINTGNLQRILEGMDWSEAEKEKIWETACGGARNCNITFDEFRALIEGGGGLNLAGRVVTTAQALRESGGVEAAAALPVVPGVLHIEPSVNGGELSGGLSAAGSVAPGSSPVAMACVASDTGGEDEDAGKPALLTKQFGASGKLGSSAAGSPEAGSRQLRTGAAAMRVGRAEPATPTDLPRRSESGASPPLPGLARANSSAASGASQSASSEGSRQPSLQKAASQASSASGMAAWQQPSSAAPQRRGVGAKLKRMFGKGGQK